MDTLPTGYRWANLRLFPGRTELAPWTWGCTWGHIVNGVPHASMMGRGVVCPLEGAHPEAQVREALLDAARSLRAGG